MKQEKGFLRLIILVVIAILLLSYFNYDLQSIVESPQSQKNFGYATGVTMNVWDKYLSAPASFLWNKVFIGLLWNNFLHNLKRVDSGAPTSIQEIGQNALNALDKSSLPSN
jgi:hypothetical protein